MARAGKSSNRYEKFWTIKCPSWPQYHCRCGVWCCGARACVKEFNYHAATNMKLQTQSAATSTLCFSSQHLCSSSYYFRRELVAVSLPRSAFQIPCCNGYKLEVRAAMGSDCDVVHDPSCCVEIEG
jgi:hypothetical protein